jgi:transposase
LSTKIHIAVDALGNVLRLLYTAGQVHESTKAEALIADLPAQNIIGDKAFDSDRFRAHVAQRNGRDPAQRQPFARNSARSGPL